jgi:hypothetical protein
MFQGRDCTFGELRQASLSTKTTLTTAIVLLSTSELQALSNNERAFRPFSLLWEELSWRVQQRQGLVMEPRVPFCRSASVQDEQRHTIGIPVHQHDFQHTWLVTSLKDDFDFRHLSCRI